MVIMPIITVLILPVVVPLISFDVQATAIATVLSAAVAGAFAYVTQQSTAKRVAENSALTTRTDIEKEAFERARTYYNDAMDRQDAELHRQQTELDAHEAEIATLKAKIRKLEHEKAEEIAALQAHRDRLADELEAAKQALALKYPDE